MFAYTYFVIQSTFNLKGLVDDPLKVFGPSFQKAGNGQ